ncbi:hypothetical protein pb186bvf_005893 [Paramecium bursaria]
MMFCYQIKKIYLYDELLIINQKYYLFGKVALVTGSTSGIGLGVAKRLAQNGTHIVLNGLGVPNEILKIKKQIESDYSVKVDYQPADLKDPIQIKNMIEVASQNLGGIQILVNNAGMQHIDPIEVYPDQTYQDIINLNLLAPIFATKYVIPGMKSANWGRIINIASVHGLVASVNKSGYVAAKHGLIGFTKATALELALTNITCNAVCPGFVMTALIERQIQDRADKYKISFSEAQNKLLEEKQPSCKAISIEQLADLILFICSDSASEFRGSAINMDGGWLAQ